jgi:tetratricopeptide (TPR) repeat protein
VRACFLAGVALAWTALVAAQPPSLGRIDFPTSGPSAAQPAFIRGVLLLHSFEYDDAIAAFREAQKRAPGFAMAYWGEAMCYNQPLWRNENPGRARQALAQAPPAPTPREKRYLDAVEHLFGIGDKAKRHSAYVERMARMMRDHPEDDEAALFYALALLSTIPDGERNLAVSLKAGSIAAAIFKKNPQHPGAAHYMLHAYDDGQNNALALEAARAYAKIAPASSHARHMPSHAFLPLGMWDEAVASDEAAFAASVAWVKRTGRPVSQTDFHPLSWLHYEYLQQGRFVKARDAAEPITQALAATAAGGTPRDGHAHVESEIGRGYGPMSLRSELASMRARYVIESRDWGALEGRSSFDNIDELFAVGLSSVATSDLARADAALAQLQKAGGAQGPRDLREVAAIMADQLQGVLSFARGDREAGLAALARAAAGEAKRPRPIARPYPIKPAAELYGEFLLAAGNARGAVAQFETALTRTPRRSASLFGLAAAAEAAGDRVKAVSSARTFLENWRQADAGRREVEDMRAIVANRTP